MCSPGSAGEAGGGGEERRDNQGGAAEDVSRQGHGGPRHQERGGLRPPHPLRHHAGD